MRIVDEHGYPYDDYEGQPKQTNYERILNMDIEEMAQFMQYCGWDYPPYCSYLKVQSCDQNCLECANQWLLSEVADNE